MQKLTGGDGSSGGGGGAAGHVQTEEERAAEAARVAAEEAAAKRAAEDAVLAALVVTEQPTLARPYASATTEQSVVEVKELGVRRSRPLVRATQNRTPVASGGEGGRVRLALCTAPPSRTVHRSPAHSPTH